MDILDSIKDLVHGIVSKKTDCYQAFLDKRNGAPVIPDYVDATGLAVFPGGYFKRLPKWDKKKVESYERESGINGTCSV
jgi:hypothetical protein